MVQIPDHHVGAHPGSCLFCRPSQLRYQEGNPSSKNPTPGDGGREAPLKSKTCENHRRERSTLRPHQTSPLILMGSFPLRASKPESQSVRSQGQDSWMVGENGLPWECSTLTTHGGLQPGTCLSFQSFSIPLLDADVCFSSSSQKNVGRLPQKVRMAAKLLPPSTEKSLTSLHCGDTKSKCHQLTQMWLHPLEFARCVRHIRFLLSSS